MIEPALPLPRTAAFRFRQGNLSSSGECSVLGRDRAIRFCTPFCFAGTPVPQEDVDEFDFSGREDPSCMIWRELLVDVTSPRFALLWQWAPGDLLVWVSVDGANAQTMLL